MYKRQASQLGVGLVNWLATLLVAPHPLPRMDFSEGIPAQARTLVVVPTMLTSASGVEDLIEALEVRFLANRDARLHFGLLLSLIHICRRRPFLPVLPCTAISFAEKDPIERRQQAQQPLLVLYGPTSR